MAPISMAEAMTAPRFEVNECHYPFTFELYFLSYWFNKTIRQKCVISTL